MKERLEYWAEFCVNHAVSHDRQMSGCERTYRKLTPEQRKGYALKLPKDCYAYRFLAVDPAKPVTGCGPDEDNVRQFSGWVYFGQRMPMEHAQTVAKLPMFSGINLLDWDPDAKEAVLTSDGLELRPLYSEDQVIEQAAA